MPDWALPMVFYALVALIISALIAEFRGTRWNDDSRDEPSETSS